MALSSMTGFARSHGVSGSYAWAWEIKSVNGKGLDLRLRLPPGWDAIEPGIRARAAETLARGSIQAGLTVERAGAAPVVRVNAAVLEAVLATARQLARQIESAPPSIDGLLALKGVMEVSDAEENEAEKRGAEAAVTKGFAPARRFGARPGADDPAQRDCRSRRARRSVAGAPARGDPRAPCRADRDTARSIRPLRS
jgi:uncharacterized protein (TIGR00255 family)